MARHTPPPGWKNPLDPQMPLANARWIVGALASVLLFAAFCVYITFCLLFWQGQWQLVFKPSSTITTTPDLQYDEVAFDATETGTLQLHGWWVPAHGKFTVLILHGAAGSLSNTVPQLHALHQLGLDSFAIDYRGFGRSVFLHPSETSTYEDAEAAWRYLTETRHVPAGTIILDGEGLGAAIAAETARRHPEAAALILENLLPPTLDSLQLSRSMHLLPIHLLFHDRFNPAGALAHASMPKLFLSAEPQVRYYEQAIEPKQKAQSSGYGPDYEASVKNFLEQHVH